MRQASQPPLDFFADAGRDPQGFESLTARRAITIPWPTRRADAAGPTGSSG